MKKRIGLLAAALLMLTPSCNKTTSNPVDPFAGYIERYRNISLHNAAAMDPFYMAHRLNLYLNNGSTDALLRELFHEATIEAYDGGKYVINFDPKTAPVNDYIRYGRVIVYTDGKSLSEPGTIWEVEVDPIYPFHVDMGDYGIVNVRIESGGYTIESAAENAWQVRAEELNLALVYPTQTALWNVDVTVTQVEGGQSSQLADDHFRTEAHAGSAGENGGLTFGMLERYRYEILSPVLTMTSCNVGSKSGGEERIIKMDEYGYTGKDTLEVDFGSQFVCNPSFTMSARIDSVWTTQAF